MPAFAPADNPDDDADDVGVVVAVLDAREDSVFVADDEAVAATVNVDPSALFPN